VTISDEDRKAFAAATRGVRRIKPPERAELRKPKPKPKARQAKAAREAVLAASLDGPFATDVAEEVAFIRPGVSRQAFRRLKRGELAIEAEIDLHGMRVAEARRELQDFIRECVARRLGCIRIVHGKGTRSGPDGPILKPSVHHWLSLWDEVLAFVSAQPRHGGSGAVYVLLGRS